MVEWLKDQDRAAALATAMEAASRIRRRAEYTLVRPGASGGEERVAVCYAGWADAADVLRIMQDAVAEGAVAGIPADAVLGIRPADPTRVGPQGLRDETSRGGVLLRGDPQLLVRPLDGHGLEPRLRIAGRGVMRRTPVIGLGRMALACCAMAVTTTLVVDAIPLPPMGINGALAVLALTGVAAARHVFAGGSAEMDTPVTKALMAAVVAMCVAWGLALGLAGTVGDDFRGVAAAIALLFPLSAGVALEAEGMKQNRAGPIEVGLALGKLAPALALLALMRP